MRLITPFLTDVISVTNRVLITEEDIYEYTTEIPEQYVEAISVTYDTAQDTLTAVFRGDGPITYRYKSILLCRNGLVLAIINESELQEITAYTFNIVIKFNTITVEPTQFEGILEVEVYVSADNNYYKPTTLSNLITTREEAKEKNLGGTVIPGYVQKDNRRFIYPLIGFYFGTYKLSYIIPSLVEGVPVISLGLHKRREFYQVTLNVATKQGYSSNLSDNVIEDYTINTDSSIICGFYSGNGDSVTDLLTDRTIENFSIEHVFLNCEGKNDILVLSNNETYYTRYDYDRLSTFFEGSVNMKNILRILTPNYVIFYELDNYSSQGGKLMVVSRHTSDIYYYRVPMNDFLFLPYNGTYYIYVHGLYETDDNGFWSLVNGEYNMIIDLAGQEASEDISLLPVTLFNQKFYLRHRRSLNLV